MKNISKYIRAFSVAGMMALPAADAGAREFTLMNTQYVGIAKGLFLSAWASAADRDEAKAMALAKCEADLQRRYDNANFVPEKCHDEMVISNQSGLPCAVIFENNVVNNVGDYVLGAASEEDAEQAARAFVRQNIEYANSRYPQATATRICITREGKVNVKDIAYTIARP